MAFRIVTAPSARLQQTMDQGKSHEERKRRRHRFGTANLDTGYVRRATLANDVLFQGKWKVQILCAMRSGPSRLGQLARIIPGASKKISPRI
jgi:hypothetical protein